MNIKGSMSPQMLLEFFRLNVEIRYGPCLYNYIPTCDVNYKPSKLSINESWVFECRTFFQNIRVQKATNFNENLLSHCNNFIFYYFFLVLDHCAWGSLRLSPNL